MGYLNVWDWRNTTTAKPKIMEVPAHAGPIYAMAYNKETNILATGGADASVGLWNWESLACTKSLTRRIKFIRGLSFSSDARFLATSSEEGTIDIAEASTGKLIGLVDLGATASNKQQRRKGELRACCKYWYRRSPCLPQSVSSVAIE